MARSSQLIIPTPTNACRTSVMHKRKATDRNKSTQIVTLMFFPRLQTENYI